jgi:RNA dependent RNA polymerase
LRELYKSVPPLGPETSYEKVTIEHLSDTLTQLIYSARIEHGPYDCARKNEKLQVVHRLRVTPMGLYLEGPEAEVSNRVLRTHKKNDVAFLRTQFSEEDGVRLEGTLFANLSGIYDRFRGVLRSGIKLFGLRYTFLGFSSSSLRVHTCWMLRPFFDGGDIFGPERVIKGIGDFTTFKSPAKCAARIGQAFTETTGVVSVSAIAALPDVERNGRIFSDGCGTISRALCEEISLQHDRLKIPPVVFQIRFRGECRYSLPQLWSLEASCMAIVPDFEQRGQEDSRDQLHNCCCLDG